MTLPLRVNCGVKVTVPCSPLFRENVSVDFWAWVQTRGMLLSVELLSRAQPSLCALPHVVRCIDALLDHSSGWSLEEAAASRHLHLLDRLVVLEPPSTDRWSRFSYGTTKAAESGSVNVLAWWMTKYLPGEPPMYETLVRTAARLGHLGILQWLYAQGFFPTEQGQRLVSGHADVVYWLHAHADQFEVCLTVCMDTAAQTGDLEFIKWLQESQLSINCTGAAMIAANERGDLEMLQWLLKNRLELVPNADESLSEPFAAHRLQQRPIQWPDRTYHKDYLLLPEPLEITEGHVRVFQWLKTEYKWTDPKHSERWAQKIAMHAAACNNFVMIEILKERQKWLGSSFSFDRPMWAAARYGHFEMVQWIFHQDNERYTEAIKGAAVGGHLHILQWLHQQKLSIRYQEPWTWRPLEATLKFSSGCTKLEVPSIIASASCVTSGPWMALLARATWISSRGCMRIA